MLKQHFSAASLNDFMQRHSIVRVWFPADQNNLGGRDMANVRGNIQHTKSVFTFLTLSLIVVFM